MQDATQVLWNWLAMKDAPVECDIIFLFGGSTLKIPEKGAELFRHGVSKHIVANGNTGTFGNKDWDKPEADMFADYLVSHGIPSSAILIQNTSTNTLEDVKNTLQLLEQKDLAHNKVAIVSRPVHQRRGQATYLNQDPNAHIINIPCDEPSPVLLQGEDLRQVATRCTQEYERLIKYAAQRDLVEQIPPTNVAQAYQQITSRVLLNKNNAKTP